MLVCFFMCSKVLSLILLSALNSFTPHSFSRVFVPGLYLSFLQNRQMSRSTADVLLQLLDACLSRALLLRWSQDSLLLNAVSLVSDCKVFWLTNAFRQDTWYLTGDSGRSCSPVDKSKTDWCCLITAARCNLVYDSKSLQCTRLSPFSLQITQVSISNNNSTKKLTISLSFRVLYCRNSWTKLTDIIVKKPHRQPSWKWLRNLSFR